MSKHEEQAPKVNFQFLLTTKRAALVALQKDLEKQAAQRKNKLADDLNAALGARRNAISELKKASDANQAAVKAEYDAAKAKLLKRYDEALADLMKVRDEGLEMAHQDKESVYGRIHDEFNRLADPIIRKHKFTIEDLTEAHAKNEVIQKAAAEKLLEAAKEDIKDVEEEIAARRQRAQDAAAVAT